MTTPVDLSDSQVKATLGDIFLMLKEAGKQRRAILAASAAVNERLPLTVIGAEEFYIRDEGAQYWTWLRAGEDTVEARTTLEPGQSKLIIQWHQIPNGDWPAILSAIHRACGRSRPNAQFHHRLWERLRLYPCVVGRCATIDVDHQNRQIQLISVTSQAGEPLPVATLAAVGFHVGKESAP